jgi:ABC-2 type transport system permease protein
MIQLGRALLAFWNHAMQEALSYPMLALNRIIAVLTLVFLLYWGSVAIEQQAGETLEGGYFLFALIGWASLHIGSSALSGYASRLRRHQMSGLLEACVMTRTPPWQLVFAMPVFDLARAALGASTVVLLGFAISEHALSFATLLMAAVHIFFGAACFGMLGIVSAAITMVTRSGDPVARVVQLIGLLMSGVFVPRDVLPPLMQALGALVPLAPMVDGARAALLDGTMRYDTLAQLGITMLLFAPTAAISLALAFRTVQRDGSLAHY